METKNTAPASEKKQSTVRAGSKMSYLIELFNSGIKDIPSIASKFEEAEKSGLISGLKYTSPEFLAKKNHAYYKKLVNWYMNQAKHKGLIDSPLPVKRVKKVIPVIEVKPEPDSSSEVSPSGEVDGIPSL